MPSTLSGLLLAAFDITTSSDRSLIFSTELPSVCGAISAAFDLALKVIAR